MEWKQKDRSSQKMTDILHANLNEWELIRKGTDQKPKEHTWNGNIFQAMSQPCLRLMCPCTPRRSDTPWACFAMF